MGKQPYRRLTARQLEEKYCKKRKILYRCIDGYPHNNDARVGYCWNDTHKGYLTKELMKRHECKEKNCRFLQLYETPIKAPNSMVAEDVVVKQH